MMRSSNSWSATRAMICLSCLLSSLWGSAILGADTTKRTGKQPPRTFFVTRSLAHDRLIPYLETARPQIVQIGNYGAMFHGYADHEHSTRWPMQLPVSGEQAALDFQRKLNDVVHALGLTVVGHFRLVKVMGNWEQQTGFVDYYRNRWPEEILGQKPHPELSELLQRDADGQPIQLGRSGRAQLALCLSSPHARQMLKQMLRVAIDHGVDGVITNYNYRFNCACPYCQNAFKQWLRRHLTAEELHTRLGIGDLAKYAFRSLPAAIPGYPDPARSSELDWLAMRWGAEHFKQMFDQIFLDFGRSLKRDLLVAQWNHLSRLKITEERTFLPLTHWGRGEDYFWYSGGAAFVGRNLNLSEGRAGDAWLSCLYVRELSGNRPFVIGKYDRVRMAVNMAEGFATGGLGMGRYMKFEDPVGFEVLARYTNFMHQHRGLYDNAVPCADAAIVLPRQSILHRRQQALDAFRDLGQALLERQILLDVVADENISFERLSRYPAVILPNAIVLTQAQRNALSSFSAAGGLVIACAPAASSDRPGPPQEDNTREAVTIIVELAETAADKIAQLLRERGGSVITSPWTVRATAYTQPDRVVLHLVNYDREERSADNNRRGPGTDHPMAVDNISVSLRLPGAERVTAVVLHAPERDEPIDLPFRLQPGRVTFHLSRLNIYAVIAISATP